MAVGGGEHEPVSGFTLILSTKKDLHTELMQVCWQGDCMGERMGGGEGESEGEGEGVRGRKSEEKREKG